MTHKIEISVKYADGLVLPKGKENNQHLAMTIISELVKNGYIVSKKLGESLQSQSRDVLNGVYRDLIVAIKSLKGADVKYRPMYPNFPEQVLDMSFLELYTNAVLHYWTVGAWLPSYDELPRTLFIENVKLKELDLITEGQFKSIFYKIVSANESISDYDKTVVTWFMDEYKGKVDVPDNIPFKENMCYIAGALLERGEDISQLVKTATDVLRIATYLSDGDISLAANTKFKSLPRPTRRKLVSILEGVYNEEDINRHRNKWNKLFHSLHVGEYSKSLYKVAKKIRNNVKIETFAGKVQENIDEGSISDAADLLTKRPGEFARRLDHLLRVSKRKSSVVDKFLSVVNKVDTRVLLQVFGNFKSRTVVQNARVIFPKGSLQKAILLPVHEEVFTKLLVKQLITGINKELVKRFEKLDGLGNVYIDPQLMECPLPTQQRSASSGLFQVARGTKLPIGDDKNTLRFFVYWKGFDIDLSATLHDENFNIIEQISWTNLKSEGFQTCHSGDIRNAPHGGSEFIDITINEAVKRCARYVAMNVFVFSGPTFKEHEKVYAGWMTREKPQSNEIYDPATVVQKIDLTSESKNSVPVIFDLVNRQAIFVDICTNNSTKNFLVNEMYRRTRHNGNTVETNRASIQDAVKAMVNLSNKTTLYELFSLHAEARGTLVDSRDDADFVFGIEGDITPYNITEINSEYIK